MQNIAPIVNADNDTAISNFLEQNPEVGLIGQNGPLSFFFYVPISKIPGGMSIHSTLQECETALEQHKLILS